MSEPKRPKLPELLAGETGRTAEVDWGQVVPLRSAEPGDPNVDVGAPIECNMPVGPGAPEPGSGLMGIDDVEAFFNMRGWLQKACEAKGAKMVGGGIGCGQADIDVELEGHLYNISIRPIR